MNRAREFGPAEATHLLRRLQFGVRPEEVDRAVAEGLDETLERLTSDQPERVEFQQADEALHSTALATSDINDLKIWWLHRMFRSANPLREKLALHWHNHFATSFAKVQSVVQMADQNELFRAHGLGSFRTLLHAVARDPAMLIWLDGNANRKRHPNENFGREVMELFALGIGNYSERDIQEAARAFSGWHLRNREFWFNTSQHDPSKKTIFGKTGAFDGSDVLDLCLDHESCPVFLASKLLRTFVAHQPSKAQVAEVAQLYRTHHLQTGPVLRDYCRSPSFFSDECRGQLIKSPLDFVLGTLRPLVELPRWPHVRQTLAQLGQDLFEPPSVKGWEGGRQWIQSSAWIQRWNFIHDLFESRELSASRNPESQPDSLAGWELLLLGDAVDPAVHTALERQWSASTSQSAEWPARDTLQLLLTLPEYQLM